MNNKLSFYLSIILISVVTLCNAQDKSRSTGTPDIQIFFGETVNGGICSKSSTVVQIKSGDDQITYGILSISLSAKGRYYHIPGGTISNEMSEKINALQSGDIIYFEINAVTGGKQKIKAVARFTIE
jgi:hypothetical protein